MTKTIWVSTSAATTYVPREKPIQESVAPFSGTISGAAPATTNLGTNSGQRILAADGTWIPQPAFTSGGADQLETLRPSVISPSYSANPPTVTDSAKAYDSDTNHATTFGQWYAAQEARTNNRVDIFSLTTWASKTQTWTAATINVSRSYAILQDGESASVDGLSSKTSSVKYEFSTNNGSSWTTLGTDTAASIPTAPQTLSMALGSLTPTMGNILVKVTITRGGGGTIYEDGVSLPGLTGEVDLKLFDVWIDGTYAGGAGNITCNNLTVTGDATFQNKIYDSTASAGTTGQVLKVLSNGKVGWQTDSAGSGTVTSITTTGANGVTISGGSTQTITTSGTFALALGNITPTSISTGTGSFSGDVEFAASIKSPNGSNSPIVISPDGTGDLHVNADSLRLGDNNADATIATNGTGDLILTTHEGSATQGVIRLYDGANGNITLTPYGTGQVQVGSDQVVTLTASQTLTNKTLSSNSVWNGNVIGSAYGGAGTVNGILKANGSGTVSAASAGTDYVTSVSVTSPVSNTGTTANPTIALASGYGDTQNPYGSKTANYFLAAPDGSAGSPTFRAIVAADIPTLNQNTTGNAATASALQTARNINGVSFNGTADITVTAAANTLTGTTLASGVTASSLTSVGTLTGLTVSGTTSLATSSGSVGIGGTASNGNRLYVVGSNTTSNTSIPIYANQVYGNTGVSAAAIRLNLNDGAGGCYLYGYSGDAGFMHNAEFLSGTGWTARSTFASIMQTTSSGFSFYLNSSLTAGNTFTPSEQMRLTSTGLGIGTSSPSAKLDVNGQVRAAYASGFQVDNAGTMLGKLYYSGGLILDRAASTSLFIAQNGSNQVTLDSSGNLGLGTSSPASKLNVSGGNVTVSAGYGIAWSGDQNRIMTPEDNVSGALIRYGSGGICRFLNGSTEHFRVDASGNVKALGVLLGNNGTKGYGAITTTTSTSTPTGGSSGDHYYIY